MNARPQVPLHVGFGCASLGSRVGAKAGLAALVDAYDSGVTWFDLAPSYGDGQAEEIFAEFARGRRSRISICTKCGIAPSRAGLLASTLKPLARAVVSALPGLRKAVARGRAAPAKLPLSGALIQDSLAASLRRLGTDHVDVLALHDPDPADLARDEIGAALRAVLSRGQAREVGIAGSVEAAQTALQLGLPVRHLQFAQDPFSSAAEELTKLAAGRPIRLAMHSVFGRNALVADIVRCVEADAGLSNLLRARYDLPTEQAVRAALIDRARQVNPTGILLFSMFSGEHRAFNLGRMRAAPAADLAPFFHTVHAMMQASR